MSLRLKRDSQIFKSWKIGHKRFKKSTRQTAHTITKMQKQVVIFVLFAILASVIAETCGGNCPGGRCKSCPCGTSRAPVNIAAECAKWSGVNRACCECIAKHESGGNAHAMNGNSNGSIDVGLWQVNSMNWASCNGGRAPCDVASNLKCAMQVWQWGHHSFKGWSTCGACGCCSKGLGSGNSTSNAMEN
eukprot:TRINITY_DN773_c0_g1_i1.p1 TRINITY_DN773_c0_g1~~TRINITY_DN773_c0_g1_i1.p1  ORF type:complete len:189 (-),score=34.38 TRINITY_DN773_c0_g1_i1:76-642(-)